MKSSLCTKILLFFVLIHSICDINHIKSTEHTNIPSHFLQEIEEELDEYKCSICFEKISQNNFIHLTCNHVFHQTCIGSWSEHHPYLDRAPSCPLCRHSIEPSDYSYEQWRKQELDKHIQEYTQEYQQEEQTTPDDGNNIRSNQTAEAQSCPQAASEELHNQAESPSQAHDLTASLSVPLHNNRYGYRTTTAPQAISITPENTGRSLHNRESFSWASSMLALSTMTLSSDDSINSPEVFSPLTEGLNMLEL